MDQDDFDDRSVHADSGSEAEGAPRELADSLTMSKRKRKREKDKERKAKRVKEEADAKEAEKAAKKAEEDKIAIAEGRPVAVPKGKKGKQAQKGMKEDKPLVEDKVNEDVKMLDPRLMADYLTQRLRKFQKDLSAIEIADRCLPESAFLDTTEISAERLLRNMADFMTKLASEDELSKAAEERGAPHTVVVCGSAVRCTHVIRALRRFQRKDAMIVKAFAKHLKMEETVGTLNTTRTGFVVGTPRRIVDLIKAGALKLPELKRLVVDASRVDPKGMGILDVRETQTDLFDLFNQAEVRSRLLENGKDSTRVVFF